MSIGNFPESLSQAILVGRFLVGRLGVATSRRAQLLREWPEQPGDVRAGGGPSKYSYEEFTRLAETRLAQDTLNKWCKVI